MKILLFTIFLFFFDLYGVEWRCYEIYSCSAKGSALGKAFTSIADDSTALYYNPAGLIVQERIVISYLFDSQLAIPEVPFNLSIKPLFLLPALVGAIFPVNPNIVLGISYFSPFQKKDTSFLVAFFSTALAIRLLENLAVGLQPGYVLARADPYSYASGFGFQLGILYKPIPEINTSVVFRGPVTLFWNYNERIETLPYILQTGFSVLITRNLITIFEIEYQGWRSVYCKEGNNKAELNFGNDELFKTIHPHLGIIYIDEGTGAHLRFGLTSDSIFDKTGGVEHKQVLFGFGLGVLAFEIVKLEFGILDGYLIRFINRGNRPVVTIQITAEYAF